MKYTLPGLRIETADNDYWIAPNAVVIGHVKLAKNASIWWNAVLRADNEPITVGENANVQDGSILHTDPGFLLTIGKNVTIGHLVMLHGCEIGDNTLIGIGSIILNGAKIGKNCLIGANALIPEKKEIPDNSMVVGSPGKVIRETTPEQIAWITKNAQTYVQNWKRYQAQLTVDE